MRFFYIFGNTKQADFQFYSKPINQKYETNCTTASGAVLYVARHLLGVGKLPCQWQCQLDRVNLYCVTGCSAVPAAPHCRNGVGTCAWAYLRLYAVCRAVRIQTIQDCKRRSAPITGFRTRDIWPGSGFGDCHGL